tara:strand:- start:217 stop:495 length:279 start_codon:yes stop_codon:yes gene_type:complete
MPPNDKKVSAEDTKMTPEKMAFNNKAIEAIAKNAAERDALRKKNKETSDAARARREANRKNNSSSGSRIQGLARIKNTLGRQFIGADPYDLS